MGKAKRLTGLHPLAYMGVEPDAPPQLIENSFPPTINYTSFNIGTMWIDTASNGAYILTDLSGGQATWLPFGSNGSDGQLLIGGGDLAQWASLTSTGGTISFTAGENTLNLESNFNFPWTDVTGTTQAMSSNGGYVANNGALVTLTLPATAVFGSMIRVVGYGAGGWKIAQNAGQSIIFGSGVTSTGVGGYLASTASSDSLCLVCVVDNTTFNVISSLGNITIV